jgi:IPT/TIG domain
MASANHSPCRCARIVLLVAATLFGLSCWEPAARAAGPRWVTGLPYFTGQAGVPVVWYTGTPRYFTDPGNLSAYVNHAAADALVAAAAGVWNVPTANITLGYGGLLAEHVSGANSYLSQSGPVFPADVQSGNYQAIQIAVIYDSDGSITDMLLGGGASNPAECRENAVTEDVDFFDPAGYIDHAVLVLNGRCTGPAPEQQLQMQYQLQRAFGRVLGVGWSQTNDNVFTQTPQPLPSQAQHWPVMHPIDIICGPYTYQCLPQPFTLRDDDVAAISSLYLMWIDFDTNPLPPLPPGKTWSYLNAARIQGTVAFPTGQGMQGVNVLVRRLQVFWDVPEAWYDTSSVSGFLYQRDAGNPVTGVASGVGQSMGIDDSQSSAYQTVWGACWFKCPGPYWEGAYDLAWIPEITPPEWGDVNALVTTEPINPLYQGTHSVGPYATGAVAPSGAPETIYRDWNLSNLYPWSAENVPFAPGDAASACDTSGDGVESAPLAVPQAGWWTGLLCAHGHTAWSSFAMQAGRTATVEVTALDEQGLATTQKAMPLLGVWNAADPLGTLPTVAATPSEFNTIALGMTATQVAATQAQSLRMVVADARGDGRPDFAYSARVLYADSVQPAAVSMNGGQIAIQGRGFRKGNEVTVNGVPAAVSSWTANTIVAVAPAASAFKTKPPAAVDIVVIDLSTGGTATMSSVLTYSNIAPDVMTLISAPSGTVTVGTAASPAFAVRLFLGDGVTPAVGLPVTFAAVAGSVQFAGCNAIPCIVLTDATGLASTVVTPTAFGSVTVSASAAGAAQTVSFNAAARSIVVGRPLEYVAAGAILAWTPQVSLAQNGAPAAGQIVSWTASSGMTLSPSQTTTNALGVAQTTATIGPLAAANQATGQACAWSAPLVVCANFGAVGVDPANWRLTIVSGAGQTIRLAGTFAPVVAEVTDVAGDPIAGATVVIHQTATALGMPCPPRGACPVEPVYAASQTTAVSDQNGQFTVSPLQFAGAPEQTNIAVATGTQGFVSLAIEQGP